MFSNSILVVCHCSQTKKFMVILSGIFCFREALSMLPQRKRHIKNRNNFLYEFTFIILKKKDRLPSKVNFLYSKQTQHLNLFAFNCLSRTVAFLISDCYLSRNLLGSNCENYLFRLMTFHSSLGKTQRKKSTQFASFNQKQILMSSMECTQKNHKD